MSSKKICNNHKIILCGQIPRDESWCVNRIMIKKKYMSCLTLFRMGFFGAAHRRGGQKDPLPKICHTHSAVMKLGTVIPYLKKIQKIYESRDTPLDSADISIFSPEISKFCYIKKYRHRLHFDNF